MLAIVGPVSEGVRGMDLFLRCCLKLLCIIVLKELWQCKLVLDVIEEILTHTSHLPGHGTY